MTRAVVIVNPVNVDVSRLRAAVAIQEKHNGWQPSVWRETTIHDDGQLAATSAAQLNPTVVIVVGGDGTVRAVAEVLHLTTIPVAIVPVGTGNLLARNLGLMATMETAVNTAFTGESRPIDVGVIELEAQDQSVESHLFLVMTGVGLDARMAIETSPVMKRRIGWLAYTKPIGKSVLQDKKFMLHYRADDAREVSIRTHTVIVGNCGTLTAGILLLPDAKVDDGLLDVVLLRPRGFWEWVRVASRLGIGGILHRTKRGRVILRSAPNLRALRYLQVREWRARFDEPQDIQLDGDSYGAVVAVVARVRPGSLHIRTPNS